MDREVALKILLHDQARRPHLGGAVCHEAYLASRLNHLNAIVIHDFGQSADGLLYIAMEFLEGETVAASAAGRAGCLSRAPCPSPGRRCGCSPRPTAWCTATSSRTTSSSPRWRGIPTS
ncbi:MAG: hypothetical protein R3F43_28455 [bacterium]